MAKQLTYYHAISIINGWPSGNDDTAPLTQAQFVARYLELTSRPGFRETRSWALGEYTVIAFIFAQSPSVTFIAVDEAVPARRAG